MVHQIESSQQQLPVKCAITVDGRLQADTKSQPMHRIDMVQMKTKCVYDKYDEYYYMEITCPRNPNFCMKLKWQLHDIMNTMEVIQDESSGIPIDTEISQVSEDKNCGFQDEEGNILSHRGSWRKFRFDSMSCMPFWAEIQVTQQ